MQPPEWPAFPAGPAFDKLYEIAPVSGIEAARANAGAIALTRGEVGITVDCLPLPDFARTATTEATASRTWGREPMRGGARSRATREGRSGGCRGEKRGAGAAEVRKGRDREATGE